MPGNVQECFEFGWKAFDLAERLQTPVFVLSDLDLGMNVWMTEPFKYPDRPIDRGKVLWEEDLEKLKGEWGRYIDVDGDGIPYRTLPGNRHPASAYFARGTGHDEHARYTEDSQTWERVMDRLKKKFETARTLVPEPVLEKSEGARNGIIFFGSAKDAIEEANYEMNDAGIHLDTLRVRALPFNDQVLEFIKAHQKCYVVEMNRDGQLCQMLTLFAPEHAASLISVAHLDGLPLTARWIVEQISAREEKEND
jgi:2-oxoglutarate ferredoxin oxidoreductase subunit alpha